MEDNRINSYKSSKATALDNYVTGIENDNDEYVESQKKRLKEIEEKYLNYKRGFGYRFKVFFLGFFIYSLIISFIYAGICAFSIDQDMYKCNPTYDKNCKKITQQVVVIDDNINAD